MLEAGVDIVILSRRLGHSAVWITDKYYLRPKREADKAAADKFDDFFTARNGKSDETATHGKTTD